MTMIQLDVIDRKGREHSLSFSSGGSLMSVLKASGLPIAATCSGAKSCATCHVYILEGYDKVGAPDEDELDLLLEADSFRDGSSRLSCQIEVDPSLAGLRVEIAP